MNLLNYPKKVKETQRNTKKELVKQLQTVNSSGLASKTEVLQSSLNDSDEANKAMNIIGHRYLYIEYEVEVKIKKLAELYKIYVPN